MFIIVTYKKLRTTDILPEMEDFNKCKFAFIAFLDVIHVSCVFLTLLFWSLPVLVPSIFYN